METLGLSQSEAELHRWAAEGLANTCYLQYAEQVSGLGPDESDFSSYRMAQPKKWMDAVRRWERSGRKGGAPPGVRGDKPMQSSSNGAPRDYHLRTPTYLLRPEVRLRAAHFVRVTEL